MSPESYSDELLETSVSFKKNFSRIKNVLLTFAMQDIEMGWKLTVYNSSWVSGSTAGGSGKDDQGSILFY